MMSMQQKTFIAFSLICYLNGGQIAQAAELEATLDRSRIIEGDSVILNLVATGDNQSTPDLSALSQDFEITGQSQSTRMTIINGDAKTSREWRITLIPKRTGTLTLPAINLNGAFSDPLQLQVLPADQANKIGEARPVLLEVTIDTKMPYVQEQVVYTIKILSRVPMRQAELTEPKADNVILERLGADINYKIDRDGYSYQVTERRYAIFPQRSGLVTIEAPVLTAAIPEPGGRRLLLQDPFFGVPFGDPFGDLGSPLTHPTQMRGRDLTLEVKPQPLNSGNVWLPAKNLKLSETWSPNSSTFKVGEPITRTITIQTQGLSAAQIPDLESPLPNTIKSYPDKAQGTNQVKDTDIVAIKTLKQALVPTQAGTFVLPEMRLNWWNTVTNSQQTAILAQRTLEVLSTTPITSQQNTATNPATTQSQPTKITPASKPSVETVASTPITSSSPQNTTSSHYWIWIAGILGCAWAITMGLWLRERWRKHDNQRSIKVITVTLHRAQAAVKQSCMTNNPRAVKAALLAWGNAKWPQQPPKGLDELVKRLNSQAATAIIQELDRQLYATVHTSSVTVWDGTTAWRVLAPLLQVETAKQSIAQVLPDLYSVN